jgi:hypothetical protein
VPASALALVVLAGLIHACWNIVARKTGGDARFAFFLSHGHVADPGRLPGQPRPADDPVAGGHLLSEGDRLPRIPGCGLR